MTERQADKLRVLVFGAHPDDCDSKAAGVAALYAQRGDVVRFVSVTNGDAGHQEMGGAPLAWRRRREAQAVAQVLGLEAYQVLDHHDGELEPTLDVRREIVRIIRRFQPDMVMSPRVWDYHPDHRATGQVVMDAMYLSTVPNFASDAPHLRRMPVGVYLWDHFQKPYPLEPDVVVAIDSVVDKKVDALACHVSQVYEWLPYNRRALGEVPEGKEERRAWLGGIYQQRFAQLAELYRGELIERYGVDRGTQVWAVEAFEGSEYGTPLTEENINRLFPF